MPRLSLVNVNDLNRVLKSEVFISEDRQLRAVHLIWTSSTSQTFSRKWVTRSGQATLDSVE